jgi:hypothetical protein
MGRFFPYAGLGLVDPNRKTGPRPPRYPSLREPKSRVIESRHGWRHIRHQTINSQDLHGEVLPVIWGGWPCEGVILWEHGPFKHGAEDDLLKYHCAVGLAWNHEDKPHTVKKFKAAEDSQIDTIGGTTNVHCDGFTVYTGDWDQSPDPLILSYEGEENTPGWPGVVYVVIEGLHLPRYGNRPPAFWGLVSNNEDDEELETLLSELAERAGYTLAEEIEFHDLDQYGPLGFPIPGASLGSREVVRSFMQRVSSYYSVYIVESERVIKFRVPPKGSSYEPDWTLTEADLIPDENGKRYHVDYISEFDRPQAVHALHNNRHQALVKGNLRSDAAEAVLNTFPVETTSSRRLETIDAPLILRPGRARRAANELLTDYQVGDSVHTFAVGPRHIHIEPATLGEVTLDDGTVHTLVVQETEIDPATWSQSIQAIRYASEEREDYADED